MQVATRERPRIRQRRLLQEPPKGLGIAAGRGHSPRKALKVKLVDINESGASQAARAINADYGEGAAFAVHLDVTSESDWISAMALPARRSVVCPFW